MILRPYGLVIAGQLEFGLEVVVDASRIVEIRRQTGIPDEYVLSPAFVNSHSHLEYRGLQGRIPDLPYGPWIREITRLKTLQTAEEIAHDCDLAAAENRATGVAMIGEHSDRLGAARAMSEHGLTGVIFQEVITVFERASKAEKIRAIELKAETNRKDFAHRVFLSPHAYQTVDPETLTWLGDMNLPLSIHVAETESENTLIREGEGPLAEFRRSAGYETPARGHSVVYELDRLGLARLGAQFVHCCAIDQADIDLMVERGVAVAHCPRSNTALKCPTAPIRKMLDAGITVGLGLDSAASSGPIDMFAEMRETLRVNPDVLPEEIWKMATSEGAKSLGAKGWEIEVGSPVPLIALDVAFCGGIEELIERATPACVRWI